MEDYGFWIKGAEYVWKNDRRYYIVTADTIVYDEYLKPVLLKDDSKDYFVIPLGSDLQCTEVRKFFMATRNTEGVVKIEGNLKSPDDVSGSKIPEQIALTSPELKIDRRINAKRGVLMCHGRLHRRANTLGLNANWVYVDVSNDVGADIVGDVSSLEVLNKIGLDSIDYVISHECPIALSESESPDFDYDMSVLLKFFRAAYAMLKKGGEFYFLYGMLFIESISRRYPRFLFPTKNKVENVMIYLTRESGYASFRWINLEKGGYATAIMTR